MSKKREYVNIFLIFLHFLFLYDKIVKISFGGKFMEEKKNIEVVSGDGSNLEIFRRVMQEQSGQMKQRKEHLKQN